MLDTGNHKYQLDLALASATTRHVALLAKIVQLVMATVDVMHDAVILVTAVMTTLVLNVSIIY